MRGLFIMIIAAVSITAAQTADISHILRSYPSWRTDFTKSAIDLKELRSGGPPKDGIPAIMRPKFVSAGEAGSFLSDNEPVILLEIDGVAKAYPLQILIWHEIVNDELQGVPVTVTFCPLCYSAIVFDGRFENHILKFGVSGLLRNSDMVMYDQLTESFWQQFTGEGIVGAMTGKKLDALPSQIISFRQFRDQHPSGKVLSSDTGYDRRYGVNPYQGYDDIDQTPFLFSGELDPRLRPNEKLIGVKFIGYSKAYPYSITEKSRVINDKINGRPIAVFHFPGATSALDDSDFEDSKEVGTTGAFSRIVDGTTLEFEFKNGFAADKQTGSNWNALGYAVDGKLKGTSLTRLNSGDYFAFAWLAFLPETEIYKSD